MSKELLVTELKKEKGKLYFVKANSDDFLVICEAELLKGGKRRVDMNARLKKKINVLTRRTNKQINRLEFLQVKYDKLNEEKVD